MFFDSPHLITGVGAVEKKAKSVLAVLSTPPTVNG